MTTFTNVLLSASEGRLFGLDAQLLFDLSFTAINIFILFVILSYLLFEPARAMLLKRAEHIASNRDLAKQAKEEAVAMKEEYEAKLKVVDKEAELILSEARKKALKQEAAIIDEAKKEALRIIEHANNEAELEKKKALDDVKKEMIQIASLMAAKVVAANIDTTINDALVEETLNEMGEKTWLS